MATYTPVNLHADDVKAYCVTPMGEGLGTSITVYMSDGVATFDFWSRGGPDDLRVNHEALQSTDVFALIKTFAKLDHYDNDAQEHFLAVLRKRGYVQVAVHPSGDWYPVDATPPEDWQSWGACDAKGYCIERWLMPPNTDVDRIILANMLAGDPQEMRRWAQEGYWIREYRAGYNHGEMRTLERERVMGQVS